MPDPAGAAGTLADMSGPARPEGIPGSALTGPWPVGAYAARLRARLRQFSQVQVFGEVFGLTVRSRNVASQLGAGLKSIIGGELKGMTKALVDSRREVMERMIQEAEAKGADAIVAMRFDTSEMGANWTEICAYGTAVRTRRA